MGGETTRLLLSVAEQLKAPLTVIARQMELAPLSKDGVDPKLVHSQATAALTLVDSYLLGVELMANQGELQLEPVSVSSMLVDAAHQLEQYARQYDIDIELAIAGRYEPVMAHKAGLKAALTSLGYALIGSQAAQHTTTGRQRIILAGHRNSHGIVTGMYGSTAMDGNELRKALQLCGKARQPFASLLGSSSAGVFVADALAQAMDSKLRVGHHGRQSGLAITFQPSKQLQFV
jgi:hypothetical protein